MEKNAILLGLAATATEVEIMSHIQRVSNERKEDGFNLSNVEKSTVEAHTSRINKLVNDAVFSQKIKADEKGLYVSIGENLGVDSLERVLLAINPVKASFRANEVKTCPITCDFDIASPKVAGSDIRTITATDGEDFSAEVTQGEDKFECD